MEAVPFISDKQTSTNVPIKIDRAIVEALTPLSLPLVDTLDLLRSKLLLVRVVG